LINSNPKKNLNGRFSQTGRVARWAGPLRVRGGGRPIFKRADRWGPPVSVSTPNEPVRGRMIKIGRLRVVVLVATEAREGRTPAERGGRSAAHLGLAGLVGDVWAMAAAPPRLLVQLRGEGGCRNGGAAPRRRRPPCTVLAVSGT
jgi:hypothetical protein